MAEAKYKPPEGYWDEIAELERTLSERFPTRPLVPLLSRLLGRKFHGHWGPSEAETAWNSWQGFAGRVLVSQLIVTEEITTQGGEASGFVRNLLYSAAGPFPHGLSVERLAIDPEQGERLQDSDRSPRDLRVAARESRREQERMGLTTPTEETYQLLKDELIRGVELTQPPWYPSPRGDG